MFLNLSILLSTAASTAVDSNLAISRRTTQSQDDPNVKITALALALPDGTRKLAFWISNTSAPFIATDVFGTPIDPSEFLDAEGQDGAQAGSE
ncbi:hypothetical protein W97_05230 [Coniosporium apollinis CBS 100218]|uniref:Uncharacterized protein n=1 Tax=Coniosporium apollinis (strain CBS 100218) TaxID=1168221 RepID=R7YVR3_CONA1|nr:uncharacterized protein W97_05230 [Coniosporium apollinis CBS 100218]EON65987.1 hypothetical protein W97_05230 [Coniosporium apollinis CBS 100218]